MVGQRHRSDRMLRHAVHPPRQSFGEVRFHLCARTLRLPFGQGGAAIAGHGVRHAAPRGQGVDCQLHRRHPGGGIYGGGDGLVADLPLRGELGTTGGSATAVEGGIAPNLLRTRRKPGISGGSAGVTAISSAGPGERELRGILRAMRSKSTAKALAIFLLDAALYGACTWGALRAERPAAAALWGALAGVTIAMLFVVGHDACHGSFTSHRALNGVIGRLAFLPSVTPFGAWDLEHNRRHHVYTNLKPRDAIWTPFSKAEYDALPRWR